MTGVKTRRQLGFRIVSKLTVFSVAVALLGVAVGTVYCQSSDTPSKPLAWQPPALEDVKAQVFVWLEENKADEPTRARAVELWSDLSGQPAGAELLARLAGTFALIDERAGKLIQLCSEPKSHLLLPSQTWLTEEKAPPLLADNMRLLYGRWLVHHALYDESLEQLGGLQPDDVVAPALLLFYQGVAHHSLLHKEEGLRAMERLIDGAEGSPRRYIAVARLMQQDLEGLKNDTLDHITRRMDDIRRRLDLGRAGKKVRKIEDGVIESLDKLIKKLEEQQAAAAAGSGSIQSSNPASDSQIMGGKGRGEVTKRNIGSESGWGDLPPKQREEALQQIGRQFPSHYRDVIEQYFRRLASEE